MNFYPRSQSGNILFFILVAVALFAALTYVIMVSARTSEGNGTNSEVNLMGTSEIVQYGTGIENAIMRLLLSKQCADTQISFEGPPFDGSDVDYVNARSPADLSCHIFHANGGKIAYREAPLHVNDGRNWAYIETRVLKVGADQTACGIECNEIVLVLGGLTEDACKKVNERLTGADTIPVQDDGADYETKKFTGTYNAGADIDGDASGYLSLCTQDANGVYYYYHVLYRR